MAYLDLDELPNLFNRFLFWSAQGFNLAWYRRADHMGSSQEALANSIRKKVYGETGREPAGPIRLLTHLRYFGYGFNPVSFYYCFDATDSYVEFLVAEVNNTPWAEQHVYVYSVSASKRGSKKLVFRAHKQFHVSPFMPMDMDYIWRLSTPGDRLAVHIENYRSEEKVFDATLALRKKPINSINLTKVLAVFPFMTAKVVFLIYFEAMRLWLKKVPIYHHPKPEEALTKGKDS